MKKKTVEGENKRETQKEPLRTVNEPSARNVEHLIDPANEQKGKNCEKRGHFGRVWRLEVFKKTIYPR